MTSAKQFLLMKLYLELEKLSNRKWKKIGEKHGISYTDVLKTYATSFLIKKILLRFRTRQNALSFLKGYQCISR